MFSKIGVALAALAGLYLVLALGLTYWRFLAMSKMADILSPFSDITPLGVFGSFAVFRKIEPPGSATHDNP